jgi:tetratricopeptide (TPR) repeat protein
MEAGIYLSDSLQGTTGLLRKKDLYKPFEKLLHNSIEMSSGEEIKEKVWVAWTHRHMAETALWKLCRVMKKEELILSRYEQYADSEIPGLRFRSRNRLAVLYQRQGQYEKAVSIYLGFAKGEEGPQLVEYGLIELQAMALMSNDPELFKRATDAGKEALEKHGTRLEELGVKKDIMEFVSRKEMRQ